jgi:hypothetical protein
MQGHFTHNKASYNLKRIDSRDIGSDKISDSDGPCKGKECLGESLRAWV